MTSRIYNTLFLEVGTRPSTYMSCEAVSISMGIGAAVAAASAAASVQGQEQQANAAHDVQRQKGDAVTRQIEENRRRATADYIISVQDEQLADSQEEESLTEKKVDLARTERDAVSQATVAAAEANVTGQSLAMIQADYRFQMDQAASRLGINRQWSSYQHKRNIDAAGVEYTNRASSVQPYQKQPVKPVDWFGPTFAAVGQVNDLAVRSEAYRGGFKNPLATTE